jgi:hypothetical protein
LNRAERTRNLENLRAQQQERVEWFMQSRELSELEHIDRNTRQEYPQLLRTGRVARPMTLRSKVMLGIVFTVFGILGIDVLVSMAHALLVFWASGN